MCQHIGMTAKTGQRCPETGHWEVANSPSAVIFMTKHNTMPPYKRTGVIWRLRNCV